jgi:hypothetical protein
VKYVSLFHGGGERINGGQDMFAQKFWSKTRFPVVYEEDREKAVIVDIGSFEKIEMILDNLLNRDVEEEDQILATSGILEKILDEAHTTTPTQSWRSELDAL